MRAVDAADRPHRLRWRMPTAMFAAAVLCRVIYKGDALWCSARSLPIATALRVPGFTINDMPDLHGKVAVVTGANTGLGYEVARQLAVANAHVILACRHEGRCRVALEAIQHDAGPAASVDTLQLDLSSVRSVREAASRLRRKLPRLHILINNAGVATQFPIRLTADGIEETFHANYLGHFALTTSLLPLLKRTARRERRPTRVVHLSSGAHRGAPSIGVPLSLEAINGDMGAYARYGMAKLASLAFSNELSRRERGLVLSNSVHPGVVRTDLLRVDNFVSMLGGRPILGRVAWLAAQLRNRFFAYSATTAALSVLYPAVADEVERDGGISGELFVPVAIRWPPRHEMATDAAFGKRLWQFSETLLSKTR